MDCIRANCIYGSEHMFEHSNDPDFMDTKIHEALEKLDAWNMFSDPKTFPEGLCLPPLRSGVSCALNVLLGSVDM